jgi:toxin HigB-1
MIRSFKHKGLKRLYEDGDRSKLPPALIDRIEEILGLLDVAAKVRDMDLPQFRLHPLTGNRKGRWAVTVRANWRVVFRFDTGEAEDVDFTDYH